MIESEQVHGTSGSYTLPTFDRRFSGAENRMGNEAVGWRGHVFDTYPSNDFERLYTFHNLLAIVKEKEPVIARADLLCGPTGNRSGWRRSGELWVARCPLPSHEHKWSFSFAVSKEDNRWYCAECRIGGDVLDLHALAAGYIDREKALVDLALGLEPGLLQGITEDEKARLDALADRLVSLRDAA